jgi:hypothetical protein
MKRQQDAFEAALSIVLNAAAATSEIDWSQNPRSDHERDLRLAIIRRVETEQAEERNYFGDGTSYLASSTLWRLEKLADSEILGQDLNEALERWEALSDVQQRQNDAIERSRLLYAARRDLRERATA